MTSAPTDPDPKLEPGLEALEHGRINRAVSNPELWPRIEFLVDSTNTRLAELRATGEAVRVLLAEAQQAGRGRRGRHWLSPPGRGLYLSMAWCFARPPRQMAALALVAGLAAADSIAEQSAVKVGLKWPNDLQISGRKLGGCLIDLHAAGAGASAAIIGIGINIDFRGLDGPDQAWTDLLEHEPKLSRNALASALINALDRDLSLFDRKGFACFASRWAARDALAGRDIILSDPNGTRAEGRACGVDALGNLIVETAQGTRLIAVGEVSLRTL